VTVSYHGVPRSVFAALAAGGGGPEAVAELARAQYSKHLLLLRAVLAAGQGDERVRAGYSLLAQVQRHDPAAAAQVIGHPSVGAWAQHVGRTQYVGPAQYAAHSQEPVQTQARPRQLAAVAAAAAIRARMPAQIEVPAVGGTVVLPTLGTALADGPTATVTVTADGIAEIRSGTRTVFQAGEGWLPMRGFTMGTRELLIDDLDPFRMPALAALAPRLSAAQADSWVTGLRDAWPLLRTRHPEIAAEIDQAVTVIVPHATPASGHSSSTTAETFGAVALSAPVDACTSAVSLTHELQHLKLFALLDVVTMTEPDDGGRFYAPWRPDPRPLGGLLQGAYAFLGVSGFWRSQRLAPESGLAGHTEYAKWLGATSLVIDTLHASGRLTPAGAEFVQGMARTAARWRLDQVPEQARAAADQEAAAHLARWQHDNGPAESFRSPADRSRS
jgi:uncharacterized protein